MSFRRLATTFLLATGLVVGGAGCVHQQAPGRAVDIGWHEVRLPADTYTVRELIGCAGRLFAIGAVVLAGQPMLPAAWTSTDGTTWLPVVLKPSTLPSAGTAMSSGVRTFWSAACRGGDIVAIAGVANGSGITDVSTWRGTSAGSWLEVVVDPDLYGKAGDSRAARVVAGPSGWLVLGDRADRGTGARITTIWVSTDGLAYRRVDQVIPSDQAGHTVVHDAGAAPWGGWVLLGRSGAGARLPGAWTSDNGVAWQQIDVDRADGTGALQHVVPFARGGMLALGTSGGQFRSWVVDAVPNMRLYVVGTVGPADGPGATVVASANAATYKWPAAFVVVDNGAGPTLRGTVDGVEWQQLDLPPALPSDAVSPVRLAGTGTDLVLAITPADGNTQFWVSDVSAVVLAD